MKATCSKSKTTVSAGFCSSFVTVFSEILILFISIPVFFQDTQSLSYKLHANIFF